VVAGQRGGGDEINPSALVSSDGVRIDQPAMRPMSPRAVKVTKENSKQRTRCVTSEFQLRFSQVEVWFIYRYKCDCD
jgi:hypothetical protein